MEERERQELQEKKEGRNQALKEEKEFKIQINKYLKLK